MGTASTRKDGTLDVDARRGSLIRPPQTSSTDLLGNRRRWKLHIVHRWKIASPPPFVVAVANTSRPRITSSRPQSSEIRQILGKPEPLLQKRHVHRGLSEDAPKESEQPGTPARSVLTIEVKNSNQPTPLVGERSHASILIDANVFPQGYARRVEQHRELFPRVAAITCVKQILVVCYTIRCGMLRLRMFDGERILPIRVKCLTHQAVHTAERKIVPQP